MIVRDKVVIVTGGANGIGRALCRRFAAEGARTVVVADIDAVAAARVAGEVGGEAIATDVSHEADVARLVGEVTRRHRRIDLLCSNAGIAVHGGEETPDAEWRRCWDVNVMAHVYAARAVVPVMLGHGGGYVLHTVSAAGLLTHIHSASYTVTKHAALAFAEWMAATYGHRGIVVQAICPLGVRTPMLDATSAAGQMILSESAITPEAVAAAVIEGIADGRFLILPHPEVATMYAGRAADTDRWLHGMNKIQRRVEELR
jgi:NAD(P)-dependent dehydrogenase (short-subunit alcohol dehydrogenase family)